jgi:hypothetical protein
VFFDVTDQQIGITGSNKVDWCLLGLRKPCMVEARILGSDKLQVFLVLLQVARNEHLKA